jgi:hypothetical protein
LFRWNYGTKEAPVLGTAGIAISDRKITTLDVEYEPSYLKLGFITPRALVLVAGDFAFQSEAVRATIKQIGGKIDTSPQNIALVYAQALQAIKRRHAEDLYLAPLGLNTDTFLAQQRDLSDGFVEEITYQLQNFKGHEVEGLVVAADGENTHIYAVDDAGSINCLDDLGFGAIGIGAWHAQSRLMQWGYVNAVSFGPALAAAFAAKRAAESAPCVGTTTDIHIVFKQAIEALRPDVATKMSELYENYKNNRAALETKIVQELQSFIDNLGSVSSSEKRD